MSPTTNKSTAPGRQLSQHRHVAEWMLPQPLMPRAPARVGGLATRPLSDARSVLEECNREEFQSTLAYFSISTFTFQERFLVAKRKVALTTTVDSHWLPVEE